ncbi:MAG: GNAT family N-acetyltransferase [Planctomycetota bacterium]|nr:MAG: GNAT family N-acetyltransferase [Planctomycetota bacterium]REJ96406.1 MAG: GNAT family N-acetyltransferase [Planctomycetota bacterium]REK29677.1 MAG: GNAT family N-acetyltransferase [Planctomycetota bacterium]REK30502.1 MAG: GNAT family N-acetyltransferase [Planctomycetota bacterium]
MPTTYYKRYRMEFDFRRGRRPEVFLPEGYEWVAWEPSLRSAHANVKFESFRGEIDSQVFTCLSDLPGCSRLMQDISEHEGFLSEATWMVRSVGNSFREPVLVGTIQGLKKSRWAGSIQNVGVVPDHRNIGLGRALIAKSLAGFHRAGLQRVTLDVTAANAHAVQLYRALGFRCLSTSYREVETPAVTVLV